MNHRDPEAAARIERAVARAVASRIGAFRVSIQTPLGDPEVLVAIEAHRPGHSPWRSEIRLSPETPDRRWEEDLKAVLRTS